MTAAATSATSTASPGTTPPGTATTGTGPWLRFVHSQLTPIHFGAVGLLDRFVCFILVRHFHEAEPLGLSRRTIRDYCRGTHLAKPFEMLPQVVVRRLVREVTNIDVHNRPKTLLCHVD